jgi:hypothetical protein
MPRGRAARHRAHRRAVTASLKRRGPGSRCGWRFEARRVLRQRTGKNGRIARMTLKRAKAVKSWTHGQRRPGWLCGWLVTGCEVPLRGAQATRRKGEGWSSTRSRFRNTMSLASRHSVTCVSWKRDRFEGATTRASRNPPARAHCCGGSPRERHDAGITAPTRPRECGCGRLEDARTRASRHSPSRANVDAAASRAP